MRHHFEIDEFGGFPPPTARPKAPEAPLPRFDLEEVLNTNNPVRLRELAREMERVNLNLRGAQENVLLQLTTSRATEAVARDRLAQAAELISSAALLRARHCWAQSPTISNETVEGWLAEGGPVRLHWRKLPDAQNNQNLNPHFTQAQTSLTDAEWASIPVHPLGFDAILLRTNPDSLKHEIWLRVPSAPHPYMRVR